MKKLKPKAKKIKSVQFRHTVFGSNRIICVATDGDIGAVKAVTYSGSKKPFKIAKVEKHWVLTWKFPFLHKREIVLAYKYL